MTLKEQLNQDLKKALHEKDSVKAGTIRLVLASLLNKEKEALRQAQGKELSEEQVQEVIATEAKRRRESIEAFEKGGRLELAEKEKQELQVLLHYLPEQLSQEQIRDMAQQAIKKTGASGPQDMGKVMGVLSPQVKGKADGALVARIVKDLLTSE